MNTQEAIAQNCPVRVVKYDPGYHFDDTYECKLVLADQNDTLWLITISSDSLWQKHPKVNIEVLIR